MDESLAGFQSYMFGGPIPQVEVLKVGLLDIGSKLLREKLGFVSSSSLYVAVLGLGVWVRLCLSLSYSFLCEWVILVHPMCRSCSASFRISFRGSCSICSCRIGVSMEGG